MDVDSILCAEVLGLRCCALPCLACLLPCLSCWELACFRSGLGCVTGYVFVCFSHGSFGVAVFVLFVGAFTFVVMCQGCCSCLSLGIVLRLTGWLVSGNLRCQHSLCTVCRGGRGGALIV